VRNATAAYNAERNRADLTGARDLAPASNPVDRLPEADADAVSALYVLVECVKWMEANGKAERTTGRMLAQRLAAIEDEVDAFVGEVDYVAHKPPDVNWDEDEDEERHTDRHLWGI